MENKFYNCKTNIALKEILFKEENHDILKAILENILDEEIVEMKSLNLNREISPFLIILPFNVEIKTASNKQYFINILSNLNEYYKDYGVGFILQDYSFATDRGKNQQIQVCQIVFRYNILSNSLTDTYKITESNQESSIDNLFIEELHMDRFLEFWNLNKTAEIEKYKYIIMLGLDEEQLNKLSVNDDIIKKYLSELRKINKNNHVREKIEEELTVWKELPLRRKKIIYEQKK